MSACSVYSERISVKALFCYSAASRNARKRYLASFRASKAAIYMTNVSKFSSKAALANLCLLINSTRLVVDKASTVLYVLQVKFLVSNYTSVLLRNRKSFPRTTSILVSASKKISSKN